MNQEMKEAADEFLVSNGLPEAPASANIKVWIDGYGAMITVRSEKMIDVLKKLLRIVKFAKEKGWKTKWDKDEEDPKARFGTKQAQAVKEYSKNEEGKTGEETCKHLHFTFKQSQTEKNPGRWFKSCKDCREFLGWQD